MGFNNVTESKEEREMRRIFEKVDMLLNDDGAQFDAMNPQLKQLVNFGRINTVPGGYGEFGKSPTNPIPVNGPLGEITYLSKLLKAGTREKVFFHRVGSTTTADIDGSIDCYIVITESGIKEMLYLYMYCKGKTNLAPKGYILQNRVDFLRGVNNYIENFPRGLYERIKDMTRTMFGFPIADKDAMKFK